MAVRPIRPMDQISLIQIMQDQLRQHRRGGNGRLHATPAPPSVALHTSVPLRQPYTLQEDQRNTLVLLVQQVLHDLGEDEDNEEEENL